MALCFCPPSFLCLFPLLRVFEWNEGYESFALVNPRSSLLQYSPPTMANTDNEAAMVSQKFEESEETKAAPGLIYSGEGLHIHSSLLPCRQKHVHLGDAYSVGTMSNSDSKSRFTTFSAPPGSVIDSLSLTTPSQSRAQSPVPPLLPLPSAMEADLVGIGYQSKPSITETFRTSLPIQCRSARELDLPFSTDRSKTPRQVDVTNDSNIILDIPTVREGFSDYSNSDDEDFNLDLERTADIALSQCFGVALSRLTRPIRVVQAFSGFRERCAEILQDEEQYTSIYWDDDSLSCYDGEESPQGSREQCFGKASTQTELSKSKTNKRCNDQEKREDGDEIDKSDDESNPDSGFKKRRRYKRRRVSNDYSCLFRKRNPKRFNVRAHEACANVSYPNIHKLK